MLFFSPLILYYAGVAALFAIFYGAIIAFILWEILSRWVIFEIFLVIWFKFVLTLAGRNLMMVYIGLWLLTEGGLFE